MKHGIDMRRVPDYWYGSFFPNENIKKKMKACETAVCTSLINLKAAIK